MIFLRPLWWRLVGLVRDDRPMTDYVDIAIPRWVRGREDIAEAITSQLDGLMVVVAESGARISGWTLHADPDDATTLRIERTGCIGLQMGPDGVARAWGEAQPGAAAGDRTG